MVNVALPLASVVPGLRRQLERWSTIRHDALEQLPASAQRHGPKVFAVPGQEVEDHHAGRLGVGELAREASAGPEPSL